MKSIAVIAAASVLLAPGVSLAQKSGAKPDFTLDPNYGFRSHPGRRCQNFRFPLTVSKNNRKSPIRLHSGYLNVAGRFFSKKK